MANFDFSLVLGRKNLIEEKRTKCEEETFEEFKSRIDKMVEAHKKRMEKYDEIEKRFKTKDEIVS